MFWKAKDMLSKSIEEEEERKSSDNSLTVASR